MMSLVLSAMEEELFMKNNVRMRLIGDVTRLPKEVRAGVLRLQERTSHNTGMTMVIALNYSSRWEITEAVRRIAIRMGNLDLRPQDIDEATIAGEMATSFMPDPDLLIRTGGEVRLSNYLLWQAAYAELYFCDTFWPDFQEEDFCKAIVEYQQRERRFGKTSEQVKA